MKDMRLRNYIIIVFVLCALPFLAFGVQSDMLGREITLPKTSCSFRALKGWKTTIVPPSIKEIDKPKAVLENMHPRSDEFYPNIVIYLQNFFNISYTGWDKIAKLSQWKEKKTTKASYLLHIMQTNLFPIKPENTIININHETPIEVNGHTGWKTKFSATIMIGRHLINYTGQYAVLLLNRDDFIL